MEKKKRKEKKKEKKEAQLTPTHTHAHVLLHTSYRALTLTGMPIGHATLHGTWGPGGVD